MSAGTFGTQYNQLSDVGLDGKIPNTTTPWDLSRWIRIAVRLVDLLTGCGKALWNYSRGRKYFKHGRDPIKQQYRDQASDLVVDMGEW